MQSEKDLVYGGTGVPHFIGLLMIDKKRVEKLISEISEKDDVVLVELKISTSNHIKVFLDSIHGITISKCVEISRYIEKNLDREQEDFDLEVSSYSITLPFVLPMHYQKNIGRKLEVQLISGLVMKGILEKVELNEESGNVDSIEILQKKKVKPEGKKKKIEIEELQKINGSEIRQSKLLSIF